jgi:toxin YoeB
MRSLVFEGNTWSVYEYLRVSDKRLHKTLCAILKEMLRGDPSSGLVKPELLKHSLSGFWSRRLSQKDRVIYQFDDRHIYIVAIGGHYSQINVPVRGGHERMPAVRAS